MALYIVVCAPLIVIAALSFLITTLGAFIAMGVTIFYWCGGAVNGYLVILFWVVIGITHNAEEILKWWIDPDPKNMLLLSDRISFWLIVISSFLVFLRATLSHRLAASGGWDFN